MNDILTQAGKTGAQHKKGEKAQIPIKLLISAALFGVAFSYLFAFQKPGLNMLVFVLLLYGFALVNSDLFVKSSFREEKLIMFLSVPVIFLAAYMFIGSTFLNALSVIVILFVIFVQYLVLSGNAKYKWYRPLFISDIFFGVINRMILGAGQFVTGSVNSIFRGQSERKKGAVIGILAGIVLLILIIPILLIADQNFSELINTIFSGFRAGDMFLYLLLFLIGASMAAAPIATAKRSEYTGIREAREWPQKKPVQGISSDTVLSMISVVYILFAVVQFGYFFNPAHTLETQVLTSSQYAVRGFGELLFINCLNIAIIAAALQFTKQKAEKTKGYIKALCTVLVAFNFVIMASSHIRLSYYEYSYGFSVARFISHSFMALLAIVNVMMLLRIFLDKISAIKYIALAALIYLCAAVAVNPEGTVVRGNIQRYYDTGKVDTEYMFSLSSSAVCEACDFLEKNTDLLDVNTRIAAENRYMYYADRNTEWQSLNLADETAYMKLQELLK